MKKPPGLTKAHKATMRAEGRLLTDAQARMLATIDRLTRDAGYPPTRRKIGIVLGVRINAVNSLLKLLVCKGFLTHEAVKARTLRIVRRVDGPRLLRRGEWIPWSRRLEIDGKAYTLEITEAVR